MNYQLRGCDDDGNDTGELVHCPSLDTAMELFLNGGFWKLSWTRLNGERVRLLRVGERYIEITKPPGAIDLDI